MYKNRDNNYVYDKDAYQLLRMALIKFCKIARQIIETPGLISRKKAEHKMK